MHTRFPLPDWNTLHQSRTHETPGRMFDQTASPNKTPPDEEHNEPH